MKKIFGIDLGTTYSSIAYLDEFGKPIIVPNLENQAVTPSVVFFDDNEIIVGETAKENSKAYPEKAVSYIKRVMGEKSFVFEHQSKIYGPEEISSFILRKVVKDAELILDETITDIVITCPAYFGINEREATRKAGEIAGFNVRQIINEPTAAAISYASMQPTEKKTVLVYDLGGGTFDITLIDIRSESIEVICTGGDHHLGGKDWDDCFLADLAQEFSNRTGKHIDILDDPGTCQDLQLAVERSKKALGQRSKIPITMTFAGQKVKLEYPRTRFDSITEALLERTILFTDDMLAEAQKKGYSHFDEIILVGGATRMPQISNRIEKEFSIKPQLFDPDGAVAKGAAIYGWKLALNEELARRLAKKARKKGSKREETTAETPAASAASGQQPPPAEPRFEMRKKSKLDLMDTIAAEPEKAVNETVNEIVKDTGFSLPAVQSSLTKIRDVASKSFGIVLKTESGEEIVYNLILKNTPVPVEVIRTFPTGMPNQATVLLQIMENEIADRQISIDTALEIGTAILTLPPGLPIGSAIEIRFTLNEEGCLHISAKEMTKSLSVKVEIKAKSLIQGKELDDAIKRRDTILVS